MLLHIRRLQGVAPRTNHDASEEFNAVPLAVEGWDGISLNTLAHYPLNQQVNSPVPAFHRQSSVTTQSVWKMLTLSDALKSPVM